MCSSAGAEFAKNGEHAAQLATKAWSAICEGSVRPWPPCLKGRAMRPRVTSSASSSSAETPMMRPNDDVYLAVQGTELGRIDTATP